MKKDKILQHQLRRIAKLFETNTVYEFGRWTAIGESLVRIQREAILRSIRRFRNSL